MNNQSPEAPLDDVARSTTLDTTTILDTSGVSWAAVAAGAVAACALTLLLIALGAGLGLSAISPWSDQGVSATTAKIGGGIYLCIVAVMSSAIGGYLAARLRTKWTNIHTNEAFFRDTAHGFLAWAFGTVLLFGVLGAAATHLGSGAAAGTSAAAASKGADVAAEGYVDRLFRADASQPAAAPTGNPDNSRTEVVRLWTATATSGGEMRPDDRTYVARLVAARTGLSQADAEKRVDQVVAEAKEAADKARRATAQLSLWLTASMLLGAFAASLAAVEGGQLRDGTWNGRLLTPRQI
jgi:hypothetical protein